MNEVIREKNYDLSQLRKVFDPDSIDLLDEVFSGDIVNYYDDLFFDGIFDEDDLNAVIITQPEVANLFGEVNKAIALLVETRPDSKWKELAMRMLEPSRKVSDKINLDGNTLFKMSKPFARFMSLISIKSTSTGKLFLSERLLNNFTHQARDLFLRKILEAYHPESIEYLTLLNFIRLGYPKEKLLSRQTHLHLAVNLIGENNVVFCKSGLNPPIPDERHRALLQEAKLLSRSRRATYEPPRVLKKAPQIQFEIIGYKNLGMDTIYDRALPIAIFRMSKTSRMMKEPKSLDAMNLVMGESVSFWLNRGSDQMEINNSIFDMHYVWGDYLDVPAIKKALLGALIDHLNEKEAEDDEVVFPDLEKIAPDSLKDETVNEIEVVIDQKTPQKKINYGLSQLKGISDKDLLRALEKILGPPIRITGSHHIFDSRIRGRVPVPVHNRTTPTGTLKNCLECLGVAPSEIKNNL